jgi:hypothetical protein
MHQMRESHSQFRAGGRHKIAAPDDSPEKDEGA